MARNGHLLRAPGSAGRGPDRQARFQLRAWEMIEFRDARASRVVQVFDAATLTGAGHRAHGRVGRREESASNPCTDGHGGPTPPFTHSNRAGMRYAYLVGSLGFLLIWLVVWLGVRTGSPGRLQMLRVSAVTALFGLTEPFFVPDYWNPPTVFDLAGKTGFDIEAIVFSFAVGGIATAVYAVLRTTRQIPMTATDRATGCITWPWRFPPRSSSYSPPRRG